jgi:hypothetical protein
MSRRLLWVLVVAVVIAAAPREAAAQNCLALAGSKSCGWSVAGPWGNLNFGAQRFAPAPSSPWRTASGHQFAQPSAESPWQWLPHRTHGNLAGVPRIAQHGVPPIDCDLAKPGDPTLDPKIIQAPPPGIMHSGVIVPVAPCKKK